MIYRWGTIELIPGGFVFEHMKGVNNKEFVDIIANQIFIADDVEKDCITTYYC